MRRKILLVEDDDVYRGTLANEFKEEDEVVIEARDGEEALKKAREEKPDVVVVDVMLPKMMGLTLVELLKSDEVTKHIPVIAVTNFGGEANKQRAKAVGVNGFVVKAEVTTKQLADIVRRFAPGG